MAVIDVVAEVTGTVWAVEVKAGQSVAEDDVLLIIESMKMEIPLCTPEEGKVVEVLLAPTDPVSDGQVVARIQTSD